MVKFSKEYYLVNDVLAAWNPIGVPDTVAKTEYTDYIPEILKHRNDLDGIIQVLEKIAIHCVGLHYNPDDPEQRENTVRHATKIYNLLKEYVLIDLATLSKAHHHDQVNSKFKKAAMALTEAINFWPSSISLLEDFIDVLKNEVGERVGQKSLQDHLNSIKEIEKVKTLSATLKLLELFPEKSLDEAIMEISTYYKHKTQNP